MKYFKYTFVFAILLALLLLCSCDYYQKSVSYSMKHKLKETLIIAQNKIDEALSENSNDDGFGKSIKDEYGISVKVEFDSYDSGENGHIVNFEELSNISQYDALYLISQTLNDISSIHKGYKYVSGTIPAPLDGVLNGYWLDGVIDTSNLNNILGFSDITNGDFTVLFNESEELYEIGYYFSYGTDGTLRILVFFDWFNFSLFWIYINFI